MRAALLGAAVATLGGCSVHLTVPAHPANARSDDPVNRALVERPAVVTLRDDDEVERVAAREVRFDGDGVALGKVEIVAAPNAGAAPTFEWTTVPRAHVIEVSAVDRDKGALEGLLVGFAAGFVPATLAGALLFRGSFQCAEPADGSLPTVPCPVPSIGASLLVGVFIGLGVAAATGGIGAAVGYALGEGTTVTVAAPGTSPP